MERESMEFDVVVVGGGPAGLATAIRFAQLAAESGDELSVCLVEKSSEIGAHILSGAVFEPRALNELIPDWKEKGAPLNNPVTEDTVYYLVDDHQGVKLPSWMVPPSLHNDGNYAISLGNLCRWLAEQAEELGVNIFPGFAASDVLYNEDGSIKGIVTGDMGVAANGDHKPNYAPGYELLAKYTVFAEGSHGHLVKQLMKKFDLRANCGPQHYAIGLKEIWDIDPAKHVPGKVVHSVGWPLDHFIGGTIGGSFLYHLENNQVAVGLIIDLSYHNPFFSPFDEFQRFKLHKFIRPVLEGGKRVAYGARAMTKGGLQALPKLVMPGALIAGDDAGFLNYLKIKGNHTAIKSGMLAAESIFEAIKRGSTGGEELNSYTEKFKHSWLFDELYKARNASPGMHKFGLLLGSALVWLDQYIFRGHLPFTFSDPVPDYHLKSAAKSKAPEYAKPDGKITFDKLSSVYLTNISYDEDQPVHLQLADPDIPIKSNLPLYGEPARLYCPAAVYEVVEQEDGSMKFVINAQNCIHCKTCDIKDPAQNINWVVPEGGSGPTYGNM